MYIHSIHELDQSDDRAVIINVNTKWVSTLALMSSLRYVDMPILMIDCDSSDDSLEHFQNLMRHHTFDLLSAPLQNHGLTLDWLFTHMPAKRILLIDSDIEVLSRVVPNLLIEKWEDTAVFGKGFVHSATWMVEHNQPYGWYVERCWIPFTMLSVDHVRDALRNGQSFLTKTVLNEFPTSHTLSRLLIKRFRIPGLRRLRFSPLDLFRHEYFGHKPAFLTYDTGAQLYQYLRNTKHYTYTALPWELSTQELKHFHGVTRLVLNRRDHNGAALDDIRSYIFQRLTDIYGVAVPPV